MPSWLEKIKDMWLANISHMFIIHGNTSDTVDGLYHVQDVLEQSFLCAEREVIIRYNRSSGITFPLQKHRVNFFRSLGIDADADTDIDLPREPAAALRLIEQVLRKTKPHPRFKTLLENMGITNQENHAAICDGFLSGWDSETMIDNFGLEPGCLDELRQYAFWRFPYAAVIVSFAETICPANDVSAMSGEDRTVLVTLQRWARDTEFIQIGSPIFLITENYTDINSALRGASSRIEAIQVPLPTLEERESFISSYAKMQGVEIEDPYRAAALTAGLKRLHIVDIILRAYLEKRIVDAEIIKTRKDEIVASEFAEVLELMDPEYGFEMIGGMEYVKDFFHRNIINPIKSGNLKRVPLGVLLPGPPGTGKTALSKAVAKESELNCAALNLSKIFNSWVGSSERNLEKALNCLEALAPCLVIIDEIDQSGLSRNNSGDSGVSNRLFKRLLEFMSDTSHRGKIVFIGLTNRPDLMDSALKRPGRFDRKLPILPPNEKERADIFKVMFSKYGIDYEVNLSNAAKATDNYTGAEIEALVLKGYEVAEDAGSQVVQEEHLTHALEAYVPTTRDIQSMVKLAIAECNDKDLLPPQYKHLLGEQKGKPSFVSTPRTVRTV